MAHIGCTDIIIVCFGRDKSFGEDSEQSVCIIIMYRSSGGDIIFVCFGCAKSFGEDSGWVGYIIIMYIRHNNYAREYQKIVLTWKW